MKYVLTDKQKEVLKWLQELEWEMWGNEEVFWFEWHPDFLRFWSAILCDGRECNIDEELKAANLPGIEWDIDTSDYYTATTCRKKGFDAETKMIEMLRTLNMGRRVHKCIRSYLNVMYDYYGEIL